MNFFFPLFFIRHGPFRGGGGPSVWEAIVRSPKPQSVTGHHQIRVVRPPVTAATTSVSKARDSSTAPTTPASHVLVTGRDRDVLSLILLFRPL